MPNTATTALRFDYEHVPADVLLQQEDVLALVGFGAACVLPDDPRALRVGLEPLGDAPLEVWRSDAPVRHGRDGALRWSSDGAYLFFAIEIDEAAHGGIAAATEQAYRHLTTFVDASGQPHILRLWNYLDAINEGDGDRERYRLFCDGRAAGMAGSLMRYPAASAIGRQDGVRVLQVYGLAARHPGATVENPRQLSAWRYPRRYGPTAPTFARGLLLAPTQLLISGTAAVVGHASQHPDDLAAQVAETLANLDSLVQEAGTAAFAAPGGLLLKAYVRDRADGAAIAGLLAHAVEPEALLLLAGDICRSELLIEIDGVQRRRD